MNRILSVLLAFAVALCAADAFAQRCGVQSSAQVQSQANISDAQLAALLLSQQSRPAVSSAAVVGQAQTVNPAALQAYINALSTANALAAQQRSVTLAPRSSASASAAVTQSPPVFDQNALNALALLQAQSSLSALSANSVLSSNSCGGSCGVSRSRSVARTVGAFIPRPFANRSFSRSVAVSRN